VLQAILFKYGLTSSLIYKMKRKMTTPNNEDQNKRQNIDGNLSIDLTTAVSASKTRNYAIGDPILDVLNTYGKSLGIKSDSEYDGYSKDTDFLQFIFRQGLDFEKNIANYYRSYFTTNFVEVEHIPGLSSIDRWSKQYYTTYRLMAKGTPIIYQGFLYSQRTNTLGYPDLIVRSDYINRLTNTDIIDNERMSAGCKFSENWHYRIVEIKFTSLKFLVDGERLVNEGSVKAYKLQLCVYNDALAEMQKFRPACSYVIGSGCKETPQARILDDNGDREEKRRHDCYRTSPFEKIGVVNYHTETEIKEDTTAAVEWIRRLMKEGSGWTFFPKPSVPEMYPNMGNSMDSGWVNAKKHIADQLGEITTIWQCGIPARELAHGKNIYSWRDPRCTTTILGKDKSVYRPIIKEMLRLNREVGGTYTYADLSFPTINVDDPCTLYIDFETVSSIGHIDCMNPSPVGDGIVYMIGKYSYNVEKKEDEYQSFIASKLDLEDERRTFEKFIQTLPKRSTIVHYGIAEPCAFKKAINRYKLEYPEIVWINLYDIIKSNGIILKGMFDLSLKTLYKALVKHNFVPDLDKSEVVQAGLGSMVAAFICEERRIKDNATLESYDTMKEVEKYNKLDCRMLKEVYIWIQELQRERSRL